MQSCFLFIISQTVQTSRVVLRYPTFTFHIIISLSMFPDKYSLQCPHHTLVCFLRREDIFQRNTFAPATKYASSQWSLGWWRDSVPCHNGVVNGVLSAWHRDKPPTNHARSCTVFIAKANQKPSFMARIWRFALKAVVFRVLRVLSSVQKTLAWVRGQIRDRPHSS